MSQQVAYPSPNNMTNQLDYMRLFEEEQEETTTNRFNSEIPEIVIDDDEMADASTSNVSMNSDTALNYFTTSTCTTVALPMLPSPNFGSFNCKDFVTYCDPYAPVQRSSSMTLSPSQNPFEERPTEHSESQEIVQENVDLNTTPDLMSSQAMGMARPNDSSMAVNVSDDSSYKHDADPDSLLQPPSGSVELQNAPSVFFTFPSNTPDTPAEQRNTNPKDVKRVRKPKLTDAEKAERKRAYGRLTRQRKREKNAALKRERSMMTSPVTPAPNEGPAARISGSDNVVEISIPNGSLTEMTATNHSTSQENENSNQVMDLSSTNDTAVPDDHSGDRVNPIIIQIPKPTTTKPKKGKKKVYSLTEDEEDEMSPPRTRSQNANKVTSTSGLTGEYKSPLINNSKAGKEAEVNKIAALALTPGKQRLERQKEQKRLSSKIRNENLKSLKEEKKTLTEENMALKEEKRTMQAALDGFRFLVNT